MQVASSGGGARVSVSNYYDGNPYTTSATHTDTHTHEHHTHAHIYIYIYIYIYICIMANCVVLTIEGGNSHCDRDQTLEDSVCISHISNSFGKGMHPTTFALAKGERNGGLSSLTLLW